MFAPSFDYYRAKSVAEAGDLLRKNPGAKLLAGGHSLIPLLKLRLASPAALIDIGRIAELKGIAVKDGMVRIGALTTHAEIAASATVRDNCPALAEAAQMIGDPAVRNRGTIGGNIAHADPASDLPTVLTALGARFVISSGGQSSTTETASFFTGIMATTLGENDLLVAVEVPVKKSGQGQAYVKFSHPASRYAVIGVAAVVNVSGGKCTAASIALGGLTPHAVRAASVERALTGQALSAETIASAAAQVASDLGGDVLGDIFASATYRAAVAPVWVKRAITAAADRAK
jgi:aerobic carbon-monoxide dehydrogenase medium subunit